MSGWFGGTLRNGTAQGFDATGAHGGVQRREHRSHGAGLGCVRDCQAR